MTEAFGDWLRGQAGRDQWIGVLAAAAVNDPDFPVGASPEDVRLHLGEMEAEPDHFEQLDDAEREWAAFGRRAA